VVQRGIRHAVVWYREALGTLLCGTERHFILYTNVYYCITHTGTEDMLRPKA